jgi:cell wall-associated NlpC family hydrolase
MIQRCASTITAMQIDKHIIKLAVPLAALALAGCASAPVSNAARHTPPALKASDSPLSIGDAIAELAMGMVGTRYRYGGSSPAEGFDCSGLVFYAYSQAGLKVPRTAQEQFKAARKIALKNVAAGDVMFFQDEAKLSHVGIYVGDGLFVHAPSSGQRVSVASIESPYYQQHLVAVGRLLP